MKTNEKFEKIIEEIKDFLSNSDLPIKAKKFNNAVELNANEIEKLIRELMNVLSEGKLEIYEREIECSYLIEFIYVIDKQVVISRIFFKKDKQKYQIRLLEMTRLQFKI